MVFFQKGLLGVALLTRHVTGLCLIGYRIADHINNYRTYKYQFHGMSDFIFLPAREGDTKSAEVNQKIV